MNRVLYAILSLLCMYGVACTSSGPRAHRPSTPPQTASDSGRQPLAAPHFASEPKTILENKKAKCAVIGPYQGDIQMQKPHGTMNFDAAIRACSAMGGECHGVTTTFYDGAPYTLVLDAEIMKAFRPDKTAYGVTYLHTCSAQ